MEYSFQVLSMYTYGGGLGSSSSSSAHPNAVVDSSAGPWMDSRIWRRLPQRLMDRVIACLPPPAFFRARAVCKRWYSLIFSTAFLELYLQVSPPPRHWFLFFFFRQQDHHHQNPRSSHMIYNVTNASSAAVNNKTAAAINQQQLQGYLFDPHSLKWYRLLFPFIPPGFSPASSSGGLICWVSDDPGPKTAVLSNPMTSLISLMINPTCVIQLPPTLRPRLCPSLGLTVSDSSIDLTFAGDDMISPYAVKNLTSESFHIDTGGFYSVWGTTAALPRLCSLESSGGRMVHVAGFFYCMNYSPFGVLAYHISTNHWTKIQAPMRRFLRSPSLMESQGRLLLVAAVEKSKLNVPKSLRMWTLQQCNWVEIERMPQQLYLQFAEMEGGRGFDCVANGEFVVLLIRGGGGNMRPPLLLFDFLNKRWAWIPPPGRDDDHHIGMELHGFAYEPRLAVPITALLDHLTLPFHHSS